MEHIIMFDLMPIRLHNSIDSFGKSGTKLESRTIKK